jgi:N4-(beta-N-acetylglucosaminyl)-L-asparaginase
MHSIKRRDFLAASALAALAGRTLGQPGSRPDGALQPGNQHPGDEHRGPAVIASGNGLAAARRAWELLGQDADTAEAIVAGVKIVEDDPEDMTVGLGGLPNEQGVVSLDASVMHGPTHKAGAVAALENIKNPAAVALEVLRRTDHALLVGEGAKRFALALGFTEENLLTDKARRAWLQWRANLNPNDDWLDDDQTGWTFDADGRGRLGRADTEPAPFTYGTIHCSARNAKGELSACTTTSGLSWKIPGRVGDSPIIGAGMYCDNDAGAAGATGRGEAVIHACGAFQAVQHMARGMSPTEACLEVLRSIARQTKLKFLRDDQGRPNFNVTLYALRQDGAFGSACLHPGGSFAVAAEGLAEVRPSTPLYG